MRARNIKPGFYKNDRLAELPALTRILFSGLWCIADKAGRLEDRPKRIKADVLPYDDGDVDGMLWQLHETGFIIRYAVEGVAYIQVANFDKHQNPHKNESPSEIPPPEQHRNDPVQAPESSRTNPADSLIPDSLIPDSLCADSREVAAASDETVDVDESIELSPAERRIIANVKQIPGMA